MRTFIGLSPWTFPIVLAIVGGALFSSGHYLGGAVLAVLAILVLWLHQIAVDRGDYDS